MADRPTAGHWLALTPDGARVVAIGPTFEDVVQSAVGVGVVDPLIRKLPDDESLLPWLRSGAPDTRLAARLDALGAQLDALRLELIEVRQQLAIAINAGQVALRRLVLRGEVDKKTGQIVLRPEPPPH